MDLAEINLYWLAWNGTLTWPNVLLLVFYLAIIALGLVSGWRRGRWAGLAPLGFSLGYSLANGIARFSGWRYDLPADWVAYFYFALGAAELLLLSAARAETGRLARKTLDKCACRSQQSCFQFWACFPSYWYVR
jgi:hypothetical protein